MTLTELAIRLGQLPPPPPPVSIPLPEHDWTGPRIPLDSVQARYDEYDEHDWTGPRIPLDSVQARYDEYDEQP